MIIFVQVCLDEEKQASLEKSLINQFSSECQQVISIFGLCDWQNSEDWNISQDSYFYMVESAGKEEALAEVIRVGPEEMKKAWTLKRKRTHLTKNKGLNPQNDLQKRDGAEEEGEGAYIGG